MDIPPNTNARWEEVVTGEKRFPLKFLAAKILLGRWLRSLSADSTPERISQAARELHAIYIKNVDNPSAKEDLETMFRSEIRFLHNTSKAGSKA